MTMGHAKRNDALFISNILINFIDLEILVVLSFYLHCVNICKI